MATKNPTSRSDLASIASRTVFAVWRDIPPVMLCVAPSKESAKAFCDGYNLRGEAERFDRYLELGESEAATLDTILADQLGHGVVAARLEAKGGGDDE